MHVCAYVCMYVCMCVCVCVCVCVCISLSLSLSLSHACTCKFGQEEMLTLTFHKFDLDLNQALNVDEFTDMCTALLEMREKRKKKR